MRFATGAGEAASFKPAERRRLLTRTQARAARQILWLDAFELGLPDPRTRRLRPRTVPEIAELFAVCPNTVRNGIAAARRLREAIRAAEDGWG